MREGNHQTNDWQMSQRPKWPNLETKLFYISSSRLFLETLLASQHFAKSAADINGDISKYSLTNTFCTTYHDSPPSVLHCIHWIRPGYFHTSHERWPIRSLRCSSACFFVSFLVARSPLAPCQTHPSQKLRLCKACWTFCADTEIQISTDNRCAEHKVMHDHHRSSVAAAAFRLIFTWPTTSCLFKVVVHRRSETSVTSCSFFLARRSWVLTEKRLLNGVTLKKLQSFDQPADSSVSSSVWFAALVGVTARVSWFFYKSSRCSRWFEPQFI